MDGGRTEAAHPLQVSRGGIPLVVRESVLGRQRRPSRSISRSRQTLARIEAAPIAVTVASPRTTGRAGNGRPGGAPVSVDEGKLGHDAGPREAREGPAHREEGRLEDVQPVESRPERPAPAPSRGRGRGSAPRARTGAKGRWVLESAIPSGTAPGRRTTAAATTGPARGPRPASSTPRDHAAAPRPGPGRSIPSSAPRPARARTAAAALSPPGAELAVDAVELEGGFGRKAPFEKAEYGRPDALRAHVVLQELGHDPAPPRAGSEAR